MWPPPSSSRTDTPLPYHTPFRSGPGRHDDGLAFLRLADLEQAGIGGKPGHAEDAEGGARRREALVELHEAGPVRDRVRNPAEIGRDMVTHRINLAANGIWQEKRNAFE